MRQPWWIDLPGPIGTSIVIFVLGRPTFSLTTVRDPPATTKHDGSPDYAK